MCPFRMRRTAFCWWEPGRSCTEIRRLSLKDMEGDCIQWQAGTEETHMDAAWNKAVSVSNTKSSQASVHITPARGNPRETQLTQKAARPQTSSSFLSDCCCQLENSSLQARTAGHIWGIAQEITCQYIITKHKGQDNCPNFCQAHSLNHVKKRHLRKAHSY